MRLGSQEGWGGYIFYLGNLHSISKPFAWSIIGITRGGGGVSHGGYYLKRAYSRRAAHQDMVFRDFCLKKGIEYITFYYTGYLFLANVLNRVWFWVKCLKQGIKMERYLS